MHAIRILLVATVSALAGCVFVPTGEPVAVTNSGLHSLRVVPRYEYANGARFRIEDDPDIRVLFDLVRGDLIGAPTRSIHDVVLPEAGIVLDLDALNERVGRAAQTISHRAGSSRLSVIPRDTRFGRVGHVIYQDSTGSSLGSTKFVNPKDETTMMLVYFDRACRVNGNFWGRQGKASVNVTVDSPGFHLITIAEEAESAQITSGPDLNEIIFSVTVPQRTR